MTDERVCEWTFALDDGAKTQLRLWLRTAPVKGRLVVDLKL